MNRHQKEAAVGNLAYEFSEAEAVYAVDYRGLTVAQISELRARLLQNDTKLKVVKNSVTKLAAEKAEVTSINDELSGPTALAFVRGDAAASAKILSGFVKESDNKLELKGGLLNGKPLSTDDVVAIAKLPTREVLIGQLVGLIASPISGTARTLAALLSAVPRQLQQVADQGLVGGGAAAPAAEAPAAEAAEAPAEEPTAEAPAEADAEAAPADAASDTDSTEE
ncbi:MAG: 50S ribosomal protein L10 [Solirubrobacteraceae bacterium]|nr:50S ribosomal protein L10 [Solirubrobacteraceae bacterium]